MISSHFVEGTVLVDVDVHGEVGSGEDGVISSLGYGILPFVENQRTSILFVLCCSFWDLSSSWLHQLYH